jgi:hypothetical protein
MVMTASSRHRLGQAPRPPCRRLSQPVAARDDIESRHLVAGLDQVGRHRPAHVAQSDETDLAMFSSVACWRMSVAGPPQQGKGAADFR